jgi:hypothetical protein
MEHPSASTACTPAMKRQRTQSEHPPPAQGGQAIAIPPQLKSIIRKEWSGSAKEPLHVIVRSIEQAKRNELNAYLTLCQVRLQIPSRVPPPPQQPP